MRACKCLEDRCVHSAFYFSNVSYFIAGYTYEIVVDIYESKIIHINGPFDAGTTDLQMFRDLVKHLMPEGKKPLGDQFYGAKDEAEYITIKFPGAGGDSPEVAELKRRALARHETCNKRLTDYGVLRQRFRSIFGCPQDFGTL